MHHVIWKILKGSETNIYLKTRNVIILAEKHTDLGQEAFDGWVRGNHIQEWRHELTKPWRCYANQERSVVAKADVVRVTDHVVHDGFHGSGLQTL